MLFQMKMRRRKKTNMGRRYSGRTRINKLGRKHIRSRQEIKDSKRKRRRVVIMRRKPPETPDA